MPGVGDLHGQGLRARGLQQQGFHLGQDGPAGSGSNHEVGRVFRPGAGRSARPAGLFGALGDIHGDFAAARRIISSHPEVPFWLCVGDIADEAGRYESLGARVYWIHGNNDNFDAIASGALAPDLVHLANGTAIEIALADAGSKRPGLQAIDDVGRTSQVRQIHLRVAGLGGTFAPTWYETPVADLPHPKKGTAKATELADKRRHFVREEVDACKQLRGVDVFLTHEAAKPFRPFPGGRGPDAGKAQVNEILAVMQPRLHLFGHHHRYSEQTIEGVRSIGLDLVSKSYVLIDASSFEVELKSSP